jgi:PKD repeat protein
MRALQETASQAQAADNTYGHGIINLAAALEWGVRITFDGASAVPFVTEPGVSFQLADESDLIANSWLWRFGDGDSAVVVNPSHSYGAPGLYDVSLTIQTLEGEFSRTLPNAIVVQADSVSLDSDTVFAGQGVTIPVHLNNSLSLERIHIPLDYSLAPVRFDSVSAGLRTVASGASAVTAIDTATRVLSAAWDMAGTPLDPGQGEVLNFYFTVDDTIIGGTGGTISVGGLEDPQLTSDGVQYAPQAVGVDFVTREVLRGDANGDGQVTSGDIVALVNWIFKSQNPPPSLQSGDANADLVLQASDAIYLVNYVFKSGPAPPSP